MTVLFAEVASVTGSSDPWPCEQCYTLTCTVGKKNASCVPFGFSYQSNSARAQV